MYVTGASRVCTLSHGEMFDHIKIGAVEYQGSKAFFDEALEPLGVASFRKANRHMALNWAETANRLSASRRLTRPLLRSTLHLL